MTQWTSYKFSLLIIELTILTSCCGVPAVPDATMESSRGTISYNEATRNTADARDTNIPQTDRDSNITDHGRMEVASRTQGVAPLSVFFDVIDDTNIIQPSLSNNRREYADFNYHWNFGDISSGVWATDGLSRNETYGFVAAHVYENPGTYNVTLEVTTPERERRRYVQQIEVLDPNVVYQNRNSICVSTGSNFSGCPGGALQITTRTIGDINRHTGSGKRILLRRGDTWSTTETIQLQDISGPMTIGAFGNCNEPDARGICRNAPIINWTDNRENSHLFSILRSRNIRITDLNLEGNIEGGTAINGNTGVDLFLLHRLRVRGYRIPIVISHANTTGHDQFNIVDCDISDSGINVIYTGSERLALLGNRVANARESHVVRVWQSYMGVISHNDFSGSSTHSSSGRHALKFHGPRENELVENGGVDGLEHRTIYTVISHNIFGGSGPWTVTISPTNRNLDERISDILIEANRFYPGHGTRSSGSAPVQLALFIRALNITIRNNIFLGNASGPNYTAMNIEQILPAIPSTNVRIFNNTIYKELPTECRNSYGVRVSGANNIVFRNNLVHFSSACARVGLIQGEEANVVEDHNLLTRNSRLVDPNNDNLLEKDFRLAEGSAAINTGARTPVFLDFKRVERPRGASFDIGAFER